MGIKYNQIVPESIQEELKNSARSESEALWLIADRALDVYENYKARQDVADPLFMGVNEGDVWRAVAYYAGKSASRVRGLAHVARETLIELRGLYQEEWGFGYFERVAAMPHDIDPYEVFEFLEDYKNGVITHPLPGRVLGVGEFALIYEAHILGKHRGENIPPEPECMGIDLAYRASCSISFMGLLETARKLKRQIFTNQDKPSVKRLSELIDEIEMVIPDVMREMGMKVERPLDRQKEGDILK